MPSIDTTRASAVSVRVERRRPRGRLTGANRIMSLALRLSVWLAGYRVRCARPEEVAAACRLRQRAYTADLARGGEAASEPLDRYDAYAHHIIALHRGRLVGTARLLDRAYASVVADAAEVELPPSVEPSHIFELSGLAIDPAHRGKGRVAFVGLLDLAFRASVRDGRRWWLCMFHRKQLAGFSAFNERRIELVARLRAETRLPDTLAQRIVPRWSAYACVLFDLGAVSYARSLIPMVRGRWRPRRSRSRV